MPRAFSDFALGGVPIGADSVLVLQGLSAHDLASVVVPNAQLPVARIVEGLPVELHWGYSSGLEQPFYGYVHHVEPLIDGGAVQRTKIVCIGATFPLRQNMRKTWNYQSFSTIVRDVAATFYLSTLAQPHPMVWPFIACAGSAWEFLIELAEKAGYLLTANQTELRFMSALVAAGRSATGAPLLMAGDNLTEFRPVVGATYQGEQTIRVSQGVDPRTGRLFSATVMPVAVLAPDNQRLALYTSETDVVANTPGGATNQLTGRRDQQRFAYVATAEARGNVDVVQGVVVYIDGVAEDYAGYWMVTQVEHVIRSDDYVMYLELGRDARGAFDVATAGAPSSGRRVDPFGDITVTSPPTVFLNNQWRSGWARRAV